MNNNYTYRGVCHSQKSNSSLDREASLPKMYRGSQYFDLPSAQKVDKANTYRGVKYVA
jgi:hypothetical protein